MSWPPPPNQPPPPPPWQGPPPQQPYSQYPPPRPKSNRNVIIAAVAVVVAIAVVLGVVLIANSGGDDGSPSKSNAAAPPPPTSVAAQHSTTASTAGSAAPSTTKASCDANSLEQDEVLGAQLTSALQKHDRSAFLALTSDGATRTKMQQWWDNLDAIGFTTGAAGVDQKVADNGTSTTYDIRVHNALDPTDEVSGHNNDIGTTQYQLTHSANGTNCLQRITSWKSLSNAPWDMAAKLMVVKTAHNVIAGPASMASVIRRAAPLAEKAAKWDFEFFHRNNGDRYVSQKGFVSFIAATKAQSLGWFRGGRVPSGWVGDSGSVAGVTFPMPGPFLAPQTGLPAETPKVEQTKSLLGSSRVVIGRTGFSQSDVDLEGTFAHEFVHYIFDQRDNGYYLSGEGVDAATAEGAARWIEAYFYDSPSCYCKIAGKFPTALPHLKDWIRSRFGSFRGAIPTTAQIYGRSSTANYYYALSATTFDYLADGGAEFALQSVADAYANGGGPFNGVFDKYKGSTEYFKDPESVRVKWAAWLQKEMRR